MAAKLTEDSQRPPAGAAGNGGGGRRWLPDLPLGRDRAAEEEFLSGGGSGGGRGVATVDTVAPDPPCACHSLSEVADLTTGEATGEAWERFESRVVS